MRIKNASDKDILGFSVTVGYGEELDDEGKTKKIPINKSYDIKAGETVEVDEEERCYFGYTNSTLTCSHLMKTYGFLVEDKEKSKEENKETSEDKM